MKNHSKKPVFKRLFHITAGRSALLTHDKPYPVIFIHPVVLCMIQLSDEKRTLIFVAVHYTTGMFRLEKNPTYHVRSYMVFV